jgi:hypothetical protein
MGGSMHSKHTSKTRKTTKMIDLSKYHGAEFTAEINGNPVEGMISVIEDARGKVYLCQNRMPGSHVDEKFGYKYSWITSSTIHDNGIGSDGVTNFVLIEEERNIVDGITKAAIDASKGLFKDDDDRMDIFIHAFTLGAKWSSK